ncbi:hypothetical protein DPMN_091588 [Dreissena polymorpha]|uniref:Cathepsin propeptide inhibitor domain-containing protein n=1 Tax=Dreissena polymorpha TaxID=45954 RepID=A0A9D4L1V3_DREPO|nr:hypothetical protein DPMN_091588 [Dreissena polymorpha]
MLACVFILAVYGTLTIVETNGQSDFDWWTWKLVHQKIYFDVASELIHRHIWEENYRRLQKHNTNANTTFTMELNHLADQKQRMHSLTVTLDEPILRFEHHLNNVPDAWD